MLDPEFDRIFGKTDARLAVLEEMPVGGALASALVALRSLQMDGYAAVRVHALWSKVIAWAAAQQMIATNDCVSGVRGLVGPPDDPHEAYVLAAQEIACATSVPYPTAMAQIELVDRIGECMPESWSALDRGDISLNHVKACHRATRNCPPRVAAAVEAQVIPQAVARGWTPSELARAARKLIITIDPEGAAQREAEAKTRSDVEFFPGEDGMAGLNSFGPAPLVREMADVIDDRAATMKREGDNRSIGLRRFQALYDAVVGSSAGSKPSPARAHTLLTVPLTTVLGLDDQPGELAGYGPVTAATARRIAADSTLSRLVTDPMSGTPIDLGRKYKPSRLLRDLVKATQPRCSMIGCSRPAYQCEMDHRLEHNRGGDTNPQNLQPLCKLHHQLKTKQRWKVGINADGEQEWTSYLGFRYVSRDRDPRAGDPDPPRQVA
ncbi:MAG TPA: DUF222 domain-containing protein [Mycobacteriales bacterium]|nr:DUF222 domain-containing protein [Mycobacteriales bacterium]